MLKRDINFLNEWSREFVNAKYTSDWFPCLFILASPDLMDYSLMVAVYQFPESDANLMVQPPGWLA